MAIQFRKRGFTYKEIAKVTGVTKSTVSNWLSNESWSKEIRLDNQIRAAKENGKRIRLLNKARTNQNKKLYAEAERSAETEFKHYRTHPLFAAGLMLYIASGDSKDARIIRLSASKMEIHRVFLSFASEFLGVSRETVRFWLLLPSKEKERESITRWSKELSLNKENFYKNQVVQSYNPNGTLQYGVGNTIIGSTVLKRKLMKWVDLILKEF